MESGILFSNGVIYGLEREGERFRAMLVGADGKIRGLFKADDEIPPVPPGTRAVDLGGKAVVPAFIDAHAHFLTKAALEALAVNLARVEGNRFEIDSLAAVRSALQERANAVGGPIVGFGLCLGAVAESRLPRASELDSWFPGRVVIVLSMDGHSSAYSSPALSRLGVETLAVDGVLEGTAHEFNMGRVSNLVMRRLGPGALARGLSAALDEAARSGLVSIHCLEGTEDLSRDPALALFKLVGGRLGPRMKLWMQYTDVRRARRHARRLERDRVGGCLAWEMDGSVSSRTAAFDSAYLDRPDGGSPYRDADEAYALVKPFYEAGWQITAHAIGPKGIESILSAYERVLDEAGDRENSRRLRIDHFEFPRPDQIARAGARRMVLAMQPGFAWADDLLLHGYEKALAPDVRATQCPLRQLFDSGCVVAFSSDAPVQPLDPFVQIAGAVCHPVPGARLSAYEALRACSWAGAYAAFEEGERGTLAVGKYADFAVLDADPFAVRPEALHETGVIATWHEGRPLRAPPPDAAGFIGRLLATRRRKI